MISLIKFVLYVGVLFLFEKSSIQSCHGQLYRMGQPGLEQMQYSGYPSGIPDVPGPGVYGSPNPYESAASPYGFGGYPESDGTPFAGPGISPVTMPLCVPESAPGSLPGNGFGYGGMVDPGLSRTVVGPGGIPGYGPEAVFRSNVQGHVTRTVIGPGGVPRHMPSPSFGPGNVVGRGHLSGPPIGPDGVPGHIPGAAVGPGLSGHVSGTPFGQGSLSGHMQGSGGVPGHMSGASIGPGGVVEPGFPGHLPGTVMGAEHVPGTSFGPGGVPGNVHGAGVESGLHGAAVGHGGIAGYGLAIPIVGGANGPRLLQDIGPNGIHTTLRKSNILDSYEQNNSDSQESIEKPELESGRKAGRITVRDKLESNEIKDFYKNYVGRHRHVNVRVRSEKEVKELLKELVKKHFTKEEICGNDNVEKNENDNVKNEKDEHKEKENADKK